MKRLLILLLLWLPLSSFHPPKVYICKSGTSYAYHSGYCKGLKKCTHQILSVTIREAQESGHKKPCSYCYGR